MSTVQHQKTGLTTGLRKKTTEACNPCRARKLKVELLARSDTQGKWKLIEVVQWPPALSIMVIGGLDIINARVIELERAVFGERTYQPSSAVDSPGGAGHTTDQNISGVTIFDEHNVSSYGPTSTIALLKSMENKLSWSESADGHSTRPTKRPRWELTAPLISHSERVSRLDIYASADLQSEGTWKIREHLANAHVDCFFLTVHDTIPVLNEDTFRSAYGLFWNAPPSDSTNTHTRQSQCMIYSVLALGALYSKAAANDSQWAANYFAEAQKLLGGALGGNCLEIVQATMLMATYAHHVAHPNLAYDYLGIAIRVAYSTGINRDLDSASAAAIETQAALRTWWTLYSLESELCLEYGKPLCIRETDAKAAYPHEPLDLAANASKVTFIVFMAKLSRITRKIIDLLSDISEKGLSMQSYVGRLMNHQAELMTWRGELPIHLSPRDSVPTSRLHVLENTPWIQRQYYEVELHFNHLMLVAHRPFFANVHISTPFYSSSMARSVCIGASRETILLAHKALVQDPGIDHWSCFYHRVVSATLVVLICAFDSPADEKASLLELCWKSLEVFRHMRSGCPEKGIAMVQSALVSLSRPQVIQTDEEDSFDRSDDVMAVG
ncbi:hypothetical protein N7474_008433 [Penicillium riverlandense]|uniref:uncharacterized protein n=1 Tax=Penicillium riverlandense TaxID=1903569 RepID=UPI002547F7A8|nr:uncharacterized protein N7474_008433 [Penicillium riverlandense]KAJ5812132.1 hypothetical protein N7474_008433 [Penicillium riverlandense]